MTLYDHLGLAFAFSPRLDALLAEAAYRRHYLGARLSLIHAGSATLDQVARLEEAVRMAGLPPDTPVHWMPEGAAHEAILEAVSAQGIDLLLAGALEKERPIRYYLGSVAHRLVREAPCSLLLFTEPRLTPQPLRRIVVVADYSEGALVALAKALRLAAREHAERVYVLRVLSAYGDAMVLAEGVRRERVRTYRRNRLTKEMALLRDFAAAAGHSTVPVELQCIEGHAGLATAQFARRVDADLLVMPSTNDQGHFFERLFPSDMEWVLREIPCNLWVARDQARVTP
jgi:nucleotide-binding universal stress UspA family protein